MGGDPEEDITNHPNLYKTFRGKAVRIHVYWTAKIRARVVN